MGLILNETYHWQLPDGGELHSGEPVELLLEGEWIPGRIEYRPRKQYILILENGDEYTMHEGLVIRPERKWSF